MILPVEVNLQLCYQALVLMGTQAGISEYILKVWKYMSIDFGIHTDTSR